MKIKALSIAALMGLLLAAPAMALDVVVYSENFNTYNNGTLLTDVPGWYKWPGSDNVPTIMNGKAVSNGTMDMLLDTTNMFALGNTQARVTFDLLSYRQDDLWFAPGTASQGNNVAYGQEIGFEHGGGGEADNRLYNTNGGFDYGYQQTTDVTNPMTTSWVFDISKSGNQITWSATFTNHDLSVSHPLLPGPTYTKTLTVSDTRGLNTMEWATLGGAGTTLDNLVVTAILPLSAADIVPDPASPGTINNFGLVPVSTISVARTVTLSNLGDLPGTVTSAILTGPFSFSGTVPGGTIAGHTDSVYKIVLDPQTVPTNVPRGTPYTGTATFVTSSGTFTYDLTADVYAHAGDVNGDGQVSLLDYNVVKANFGNAYESGNHWGDGDVNGDLQVGLLDFNIVKAHFGHTTGDGAAVTAVPEPATMSLLALAGLAALRRKR